MNKNDCAIVKDLLPNYIDNLTSKETNDYIKNHLENCKNCKEVYENMKKTVKVNKIENNKKDVKYLKKFNIKVKELKILIAFISILALIVTLFLVNKVKNNYIIADLESKLSKLDYSNYSYTMKIKKDNYEYEAEYFVLGDKYYAEIKTLNSGVSQNIRAYKDEKDYIILRDTGKEKTYRINDKTNLNINIDVIPTNPKDYCYIYYFEIINNVKRISNVEKDYYLIESKNGFSLLVEKSTGLIKKCTVKSNEKKIIEEQTIEYNFGNVKESDLKKLDLTQYLEDK